MAACAKPFSTSPCWNWKCLATLDRFPVVLPSDSVTRSSCSSGGAAPDAAGRPAGPPRVGRGGRPAGDLVHAVVPDGASADDFVAVGRRVHEETPVSHVAIGWDGAVRARSARL